MDVVVCVTRYGVVVHLNNNIEQHIIHTSNLCSFCSGGDKQASCLSSSALFFSFIISHADWCCRQIVDLTQRSVAQIVTANKQARGGQLAPATGLNRQGYRRAWQFRWLSIYNVPDQAT